jgi:ketosteroid isomerase-like protein
MTVLRTLAAVTILAATLSACAPKQTNIPFSAAAVDASEDARKRGDYEALSSMYTEDGKLLPPNSAVIEGRTAIREFLRKLAIDEDAPIELNQREVVEIGNFAYRDGVLSQHHKDGTTEIGKFVQLWKYSDGVWRLHRVIWNMNGPDYFLPAASEAGAAAPKN